MRLSTADLYSELNVQAKEIRLISLDTSLGSTNIDRCTFQTFSLQGAPDYYALSYLWGDPNHTEAMIVNGIKLQVTTNLLALLRQLRKFITSCSTPSELPNVIRSNGHSCQRTGVAKDQEPTYLWADAICIDQGNRQERGHQVKLMGEIYQKAFAVIGWMGPETRDSTKAITAVQLVAKEAPTLYDSKNVCSLLSRYPEAFGDSAIWPAISALWRREYWGRTWVVQELVLNDNVVLLCGSTFLDIDNLHVFDLQAKKIRALDVNLADISVSPDIDCIILLRDFWKGPAQKSSLSQFYPLSQVRTSRCTDLRDKVYGVLGMTKISIDPDYSLPTAVAYTKTAHEMLRKEGLTSCFGLAGTAINKTPNLPSWVPDWSYEEWGGWDLTRWSGVEPRFLSADFFEISSKDLHVLHVAVMQVAEVAHTGPAYPRDATEQSATLWATQFIKLALKLRETTKSTHGVPALQALLRLTLFDGNILSTALWRPRIHITDPEYMILAAAFLKVLCCAVSDHPEQHEDGWLRHMAEFGVSTEERSFSASFRDQFLGDITSPVEQRAIEASVSGIDEGHCQWLRTRIERTIAHHQCFITDRGLLGAGPGVRKGDMVFAVKGCKMPVILREVGSHLEMVGPTFVPGIMDGELFQDGCLEPAYERIELR